LKLARVKRALDRGKARDLAGRSSGSLSLNPTT
jgi:hypothetical protein